MTVLCVWVAGVLLALAIGMLTTVMIR